VDLEKKFAMVPQADPAHHAGRGQASYFVKVEARKAKATQRDESGGRVLGKGAASPSPPRRGLGNAVSSPSGVRAVPRPLKGFIAF